MADDREELFFPTRQELRSWLAGNWHRVTGVWAIFYKKSTGLSDLSWDAVAEECLCFGWIDSLPGKVDETRTRIYISPRKPDSGWSRRNKLLLEDLRSRGLLEKPGLAAINRAKNSGSWERFDLAEALVLPVELQQTLDEDDVFSARWALMSESKKRQALQQIYDAKSEATRLKGIASLRETLHLPRSEAQLDPLALRSACLKLCFLKLQLRITTI